MAITYRSRQLGILARNEQAMRALYQQLAAAIGAEVTRRAAPDGSVPRAATLEIQQAANLLITNFFLGYNRSGQRAPFAELPDGTIEALAPYTRQLWASIKAAVRLPIAQNAAIIEQRLPTEILNRWRSARINPLAAARMAVAETVFRPNPLAAYEPPHAWVDPAGYRLSDRVWNTSADTRRQIDQFLDLSIREGRGALDMSRLLAQFLTPGEGLRTTKAPYGRTASYSGMRLARTEITHAAGAAAEAAAAMNPFVAGMQWRLSPSHPKPDVCDGYARGGVNGDGIYPLGSTPPYPAHPNCLCWLGNVMIQDPDKTLDALRDEIRSAKADLLDKVGPVAVDEFTEILLGRKSGPATAWPAAIPVKPAPLPKPKPAPKPKKEPKPKPEPKPEPVKVPKPSPVKPEPALPAKPIPPAPVLIEIPPGLPVPIPPRPAPAPVVPPPVILPPARIELDYQPRQKDLDQVDFNVNQRLTFAARQLRTTPEAIEAGARAALTELTANKEIAIQFKTKFLNSLLDDGRFKTQFETNSSGGAMDKQLRATAEYAGLGAPLSLDPTQRPIYGYLYLDSIHQKYSLGQYGDITFMMKDEVKNRATVTAGDSLYNFRSGNVAGTPVRAPERQSFDNEVAALYQYNKDRNESDLQFSVGYLEVQMQKGISLKDVRRVLDPDENLSQAHIKRLQGLGIEIERAGKVLPMPEAEEKPKRSRGAAAGADPDAGQALEASEPVPPGLARRIEAERKRAEDARLAKEAERLAKEAESLAKAAERGERAAKLGYDPDSPEYVRKRFAEIDNESGARLAELNERISATLTDYSTRSLAIDALYEKSLADTKAGKAAAKKLVEDKAALKIVSASMQALEAERSLLTTERKSKIDQLLNVRDPAKATIQTDATNPITLIKWNAGLDIFNKLVSAEVAPALAVKFEAFDGRSKYTMADKTVRVMARGEPAITAHELGHWLEDHNPEVFAKSLAFFESRTKGEATAQLVNFAEGEIGKKDDFMTSYMGRQYISKKTGKPYASEILSMGIEYMHTQPLEFAAKDPEYFDFVFRTLRGL